MEQKLVQQVTANTLITILILDNFTWINNAFIIII